jgi:hypothetical protein
MAYGGCYICTNMVARDLRLQHVTARAVETVREWELATTLYLQEFL